MDKPTHLIEFEMMLIGRISTFSAPAGEMQDAWTAVRTRCSVVSPPKDR